MEAATHTPIGALQSTLEPRRTPSPLLLRGPVVTVDALSVLYTGCTVLGVFLNPGFFPSQKLLQATQKTKHRKNETRHTGGYRRLVSCGCLVSIQAR